MKGIIFLNMYNNNINTIFSDDIKAYKAALSSIPSSASAVNTSLVRNDTNEHAKALIIELLSRAKESVKIKSSMFCEEFYKNTDIFNAFKKLDESVKVSVLVSYEDKKQTDAINDYKKELGERIKFKYISSNPIKINDFMLVDEHSFRYELEAFNREACKEDKIKNINAIAYFNIHTKEKEKIKGQLLNKGFHYLHSLS